MIGYWSRTQVGFLVTTLSVIDKIMQCAAPAFFWPQVTKPVSSENKKLPKMSKAPGTLEAFERYCK
jgi:hypothetical protein